MSKKIDDKGNLSREEASVKVQLMELEELKSLDTEAESSGDGSWAQRAGQKDGQTNCKLGKKRPSRRSLEARGWRSQNREKTIWGRMKRPD